MIVASQASLSFGSILVGASNSLSLTLTNTGKAKVDFEGITVVSDEPTVFTVAANCVILKPGHSCTATVTFRSTTPGAFSGTLQIPFNPPQSLMRIPLSATATAVAATPGITASSSSLAFGTILEGAQSAFALTLINTGNATLTISGVTIIGPQSASFTSIINHTSVAPEQTAIVTVSFKPNAAGLCSATLQIAHDAAHNPLLIPLTGVGTILKHKDSKEVKESLKDAKEVTKDTKEVKEALKDSKEAAKDTKEATKEGKEVKETIHDKNPILETKPTSAERIPLTNEFHAAPTAPLPSDEPPTQHSFITPEERPQIGPRQPPKDDSPE